jgi:hypothetical protein
MKEPWLDIKLTKTNMIRLCKQGSFLGGCRDKEYILSPGSVYFIRKFEDRKLCVIIQQIGEESITLGSKSFNEDNDVPVIDLFLSIKRRDAITSLILSDSISSTTSQKKRKSCRYVGMHNWS